MPKTKKSNTGYRTAVQMFFLVFVTLLTINYTLEKTGSAIPFFSVASIHAICPFGGVVSIYQFITTGSFVQKIHESSFILMFASLILAVGFGPVICGWVCPLGTFQEYIGKLGRKIFGSRYNQFIPQLLDRYLRYLRYGVLIMVLYITATTTKLIFQDVDPYYALFNFWSEEVALSALVVLGITIVLSFFVERPWCKYACPYGAVLGIFNLFRIFKIRRSPSTCINCKKCDKSCPMNITVSSGEKVINHQCISCMKCTSEISCPVAGTVEFSTKGEKTA
ncbi:MAG: 4Fe-4S binding protein [Peptococcaceae bacterium]|nr:4Fe-4S binding protein [Peptococcaceae bacterium]